MTKSVFLFSRINFTKDVHLIQSTFRIFQMSTSSMYVTTKVKNKTSRLHCQSIYEYIFYIFPFDLAGERERYKKSSLKMFSLRPKTKLKPLKVHCNGGRSISLSSPQVFLSYCRNLLAFIRACIFVKIYQKMFSCFNFCVLLPMLSSISYSVL